MSAHEGPPGWADFLTTVSMFIITVVAFVACLAAFVWLFDRFARIGKGSE
jgi:hypothetical protein